MSKFKLDLTKVAEAKQAADAKNASFGPSTSVKWYKFEGNKAKLRLMPPWTGEGDFKGQPWRVVAQHWHVTEESKGPILCPKQTPHLGEDCPICDFVDGLRAQTDNVEAKELAADIKAKQAYFFSVVDLADPEYSAKDVSDWKRDRPDKDMPFKSGDPKIQVYAAPFTVFNAIISVLEQGVDIFDLSQGHNVIIERSGKGKHTKYTVNAEIKSTSSNVEEDQDMIDLSKVGIVHPKEKLRELLENGVGGAFDEILPSVPATKALPKSAPAKPVAAKAKKVEVVEDDEDEPLAHGDDEDEDVSELEKTMMGDDD